jgi:branched-chain amino acid transport system ATP-binding protein
MALLKVDGLTKHFGGLAANSDVSFHVDEGELVGVIGPNGAGKTTLFNCITGFYAPTAGRIEFKGRDIAGLPAHRVARLGLARTFQVYAAVGDLTALEYVMVGAFMRHASRTAAREASRGLMRRFGLERWSETLLSDMPVPAQKLVTMAAAVATGPSMLLLDEVAAGLNPAESERIMEVIGHVRGDMGITVMLIEHMLEMVMRLCERVMVLDYGMLIAQGPPAEVSRHPEVIRAYLGASYGDGPDGGASVTGPADALNSGRAGA